MYCILHIMGQGNTGQLYWSLYGSCKSIWIVMYTTWRRFSQKMDYSIAVGSNTVKEVWSFFAILGPASSKYNSDQERTAKNGEKLVTWWPEVGNRFFLVALSLFVLSCNCAILRVKWKAYSPPRFSRYRWLSLTISPPSTRLIHFYE